MKRRIQRGTIVRDLRGKVRKVVKVVHSLAYELDGEPLKLYQPNEVKVVSRAARERGTK